jgi:hypothetical protein
VVGERVVNVIAFFDGVPVRKLQWQPISLTLPPFSTPGLTWLTVVKVVL